MPEGSRSDGNSCDHAGETSTYCTKCWANLYEARQGAAEGAPDTNSGTVLYPFMVLAGCGLILSILAHIMALLGLVTPGGNLVWGLHAGVFVVWIPTVLTMFRVMRASIHTGAWTKGWTSAFAGCPHWMRRGVYLLFGYAMFNFVLFIAMVPGQKVSGAAPPAVVRGFSGHWMAFYGAAFATLYSAIYAPQHYRERKCPLGHTVAPTARYCSECGYMFSKDSGALT